VPSSSIISDEAMALVPGVMRLRSSMPSDITAVPSTGKILYRPLRLMSCPETIDVTSMPTIIGSISSPDAVGLTPFTTWRNTGKYVTEPNNAKPTISPMTDVTVNVLSRKSRSGSTGSAARRSTSTNTINPVTAAAINPSTSDELQAYDEPPTSDTSVSAVRKTASKPAPA